MTVMTTTAIQALIPNRYPLFYIDRVVALEPDQHIVAEKYVSVAEDHLCGYDPTRLTMPPSLIIETLAQAASILILKSPQFADKTAYLASIDECTFAAPVFTGSVLTLTVDLIKVRASMGVVHTNASVEGRTVAQAALHFVVDAATRA